MSTPDIADRVNGIHPWSGSSVQADSLMEFDGQAVGFCNAGCRFEITKASDSGS